jgi:hypothetical protein
MGNTVYYCEIEGDYTPEFPKGVISIPYRVEYFTKIRRCMSYSQRVWAQGSRGGVRIVKNRMDAKNLYGYVTKNEEAMKQFMWVKLQAQPLANYT